MAAGARGLGDDEQVGTGDGEQVKAGDGEQVRAGDGSSPVDQAVVAAQLRAVTVGLIRRLRSTASPGDLTWSQESALLRLETGGPQTISQLARAEGTRSQSMGAIVASLEAQGLVDRAADARDGRQSIITVSDAGRLALDDARAVKQDWLAERLTYGLNQHEQGILAQAVPLLQRIVDLSPEGPQERTSLSSRRHPSSGRPPKPSRQTDRSPGQIPLRLRPGGARRRSPRGC
jgi:DNA-binding MarR family transcriptional regulator